MYSTSRGGWHAGRVSAPSKSFAWFLWSKISADRLFGEQQISDYLDTLHLFGDPALLRRDLVDLGLMRRNRDGSDYRRVEKEPPPELALLLRLLGQDRRKAA